MSTSSPFKSRSVIQHVLSVEQPEGVGARVRRSIGRPELRNLDPFLMLDEIKSADQGGFPDHPHRGFETVTYVHPSSVGRFQHEDFCGNKGEIGTGDVQWMTAGRGILHSEMPVLGSGTVHGFQLWINLSKKDKMVEPAYQELKKSDYPHPSKDGVTAHVIAGESLGAKSPVYTRQPTSYIHFEMSPNSTLQQPIDKDWNSFIYTISGKAKYNGKSFEPHHTLVLSKGQDTNGIEVNTEDSPAEFLLISGKPTNEPVVQHGPFVMNTREEIYRTFQDFTEGRNGFEKAPQWQSKIGRRLTVGGHDDDDEL